MDVDGLVPEQHRIAAEEIRAHLVAVRGGAPFLSSSDARQLVLWLEAGENVAVILAAIERAAEVRRKTRSRLPLTLGRAKAYVDKVRIVAKPPVLAAEGPPFGAIADAVRYRGEAQLADGLSGLSDELPDDLVRAALRLVRAFFANRWELMPDQEREDRLVRAREELAVLELDEIALESMAEELARDALRAEWPMLSAGTFANLAHGGR